MSETKQFSRQLVVPELVRLVQLGAQAAGTQTTLTGPPDEPTGSCLSGCGNRDAGGLDFDLSDTL